MFSAQSFSVRLAVILAIAFFSSTAQAQQARQWVSDDGRFKAEAELVSFDGQTVMLKKLSGVVINVPLNRLSNLDREYLETHKTQERVKLQDTQLAVDTRFDYRGGRFVKEGRVWREYCNPDPTFGFYFREIKRDN